MEITIDLMELLIIIICVAVVLLTGYLIGLIKNLTITVKHTNKIMEDAEVISAIAAERTKDVDETISNVGIAVKDLGESLKGNKSVIKTIQSLIKALNSLKSMLSNKKE